MDEGTAAPVNRKAVYSVVLGVAGFLCLYAFPFGAFALGVPALTTGVHGRREITASRGAQSGDAIAVCGLIVGAAAVLVGVITLVLDEVTR